ncbi:MAG: helix-turn-helix domain-containing protein [Nitrospinota bacterium]|nr:helix-turn-helix domain-containing protein [Nitrospinota bacterium]
MTPLFQIIRKAGGVSPCLSSATADWQELGKEFRRAGHQGVIFSNGTRGRAADEMLADLDPDIQARVMAGAETNHPLLDALSRELDTLPDRYTGPLTRFDLEAENTRLREENRALESRLALLEPDPDEHPRMEDIAPGAIREARNALNLTQAQAARRLGVSWLTLSRWENGRTKPTSPAHVRALVAMLNDAQAGMVAGGTPF